MKKSNVNKELVKSQQLVSKAVGVFSQAIQEVEKANEILTKGVEADSMAIVSIKEQIASLNNKITDIETAKHEKGTQLKANTSLIKNLQRFTKGGQFNG